MNESTIGFIIFLMFVVGNLFLLSVVQTFIRKVRELFSKSDTRNRGAIDKRERIEFIQTRTAPPFDIATYDVTWPSETKRREPRFFEPKWPSENRSYDWTKGENPDWQKVMERYAYRQAQKPLPSTTRPSDNGPESSIAKTEKESRKRQSIKKQSMQMRVLEGTKKKTEKEQSVDQQEKLILAILAKHGKAATVKFLVQKYNANEQQALAIVNHIEQKSQDSQ